MDLVKLIGSKSLLEDYGRVDEVWIEFMNFKLGIQKSDSDSSGTLLGVFEKRMDFLYICDRRDINLLDNFPLSVYKFDLTVLTRFMKIFYY